MKAILLILLFTMIASITAQRRAPPQKKEEKISDAEIFYNNPPDVYATAKKYFDEGKRFEQLMGKLQNRNNRIEESYTLCEGYSPKENCTAFVDEIAKRL